MSYIFVFVRTMSKLHFGNLVHVFRAFRTNFKLFESDNIKISNSTKCIDFTRENGPVARPQARKKLSFWVPKMGFYKGNND